MNFYASMGEHDSDSIQLPIDKDLGSRIFKWGRDLIPDYVLTGNGRENEPHITVLYGILPGQDSQVEPLISSFGKPIELVLGQVSLFDCDEFDVVKVEILSDSIHELRNHLETKLINEQSHPEFKPHFTIAYVRKGSCEHLNGRKDFYGCRKTVYAAEFSRHNGIVDTIPLIGDSLNDLMKQVFSLE